jgi:hypothetical protein
MQVLVRPAFRKHRVGAFGGYLTPRFVPKFVNAVIGTPSLLPEQMGSVANDLVQVCLGSLASRTAGQSIRLQYFCSLSLDVD